LARCLAWRHDPRYVATAEQVAELQVLARSERRDEADRARAILLSLEGWTSAGLGVAFGVGADSVRRWRVWFCEGGVDALRASPPPGRSPAKGEWALAVAEEILAEPVENRPNWTLPRLQDEIEKRTEVRISQSRLSVVLRKKGAFAGDARGTASRAGKTVRRSHARGCGSNS
jgi:transposase